MTLKYKKAVFSLEEFKDRYQGFSAEDKENNTFSLRVPAHFEKTEASEDKLTEGLIPIVAKAYHDGVNINSSSIDTEVFKEKTKTINYRPILAHIEENANGVRDFVSHSYETVESEDGNIDIKWLEQPIGVLTNQYEIVYDEAEQVNRAVVKGYLYSDFCDEAIEILEKRQSVDCSIELIMNKYSYDDSTKLLTIDDYYIRGLTLLGEDYLPGMKGSQVVMESKEEEQTASFSADSNEIYKEYEERLSKIESALLSLSEMTSDKEQKGEESVENNISTYLVVEKDGEQFQKFDISYSDKNCLVVDAFFNQIKDEQERWRYEVIGVYDKFIVSTKYGSGKYQRLDYAVENETVRFDGDNKDVEPYWMTKEERAARAEQFEAIKAELETTKDKLSKFEEAELNAQKEAVLEDEAYADFIDTAEFAAVKEAMAECGVEELRTKAELAFAACTRKQRSKSQEKEAVCMKFTNPNIDDVKVRGRYGAIFED